MASSTLNSEKSGHTTSEIPNHTPETTTPTKPGPPPQLSPVSALLASLGITREKLVERADDVRKLLSSDQPSGSSSAAVEPVTPSAERTVRTPLKRSNTTESLFTPPATSSPKRSSNPSGPVTPRTPSRTRKSDTMEEVIERKNRESANRSARKQERHKRTEPSSPSTGRSSRSSQASSSSTTLERTQSTPNLIPPTSRSSSITSGSSKAESSNDTSVTEPAYSKYYRAHTLVDKFSVSTTETAPPPPMKKKAGSKAKLRGTKTHSTRSSTGSAAESTLRPSSVPATAQSSSQVAPMAPQIPQTMNMIPPFGFPPQAIPFFVPVPQPLPGMPQLTQEQMQALFYQQFTLMMQQHQFLQQPTTEAQSPPSTAAATSPQIMPTTPKKEKEVIDLLSPLPPSSSPSSSPPSSPPRSEASEAVLPYTLPPGPYSPSKPSVSYAAMIGQAVLSSPEHRLTLQQIYDYITVVYPYFKRGETTWMNSIRHVLSTTKAFQKVIRDKRQGKTQWAIFDDDLPCFEGGGYKKHGAAASGSGGARKRKREVADNGESPKSMTIAKKGRKNLKKVAGSHEEQAVPPAPQTYASPQRANPHGPPLYAYAGGEHFLPSFSPGKILLNPPSVNEEIDSDRLLRELEDALSSADDLDDLPPSDDFNFLDSEDLPPSSDDFDAYTSEFSDGIPLFHNIEDQTPRRSSSTPPTSLPPSTTDFGFDEDEDRRSTSEDELPMLSPSDLLKPIEQWGKPSPIQPITLNYGYDIKFNQDSDEDEPLDLHSLSGSHDKLSKDKDKDYGYPVSPSIQRTVKKRALCTPPGRQKALHESPLFTGPSSSKTSHSPIDDTSPLARRHKPNTTGTSEAPSTPPRRSSLQLPMSSLRTPVTKSPHLTTSPSPSASRKLLFQAEDNPDPDDSFDSLFNAPDVPTTPSTKRSSSDLTSYQQPPMTPKRTNAPPVTPKRSSSKKHHGSVSGSGGFSGTPSRYVRSYASKNGSMSSPFRTPGSGSFPFANLLEDTGFNMSPIGFESVLGLSSSKSTAFLSGISPSGLSPKHGGVNTKDDERSSPSPSIRKQRTGW